MNVSRHQTALSQLCIAIQNGRLNIQDHEPALPPPYASLKDAAVVSTDFEKGCVVFETQSAADLANPVDRLVIVKSVEGEKQNFYWFKLERHDTPEGLQRWKAQLIS